MTILDVVFHLNVFFMRLPWFRVLILLGSLHGLGFTPIQAKKPPQLRIGVMATPMMTNLTYPSFEDPTPGLGIAWGLHGVVDFPNSLSMAFGMFNASVHMEETVETDIFFPDVVGAENGLLDIPHTFRFVRIPLLLHYRLADTQIHAFMQFGPQLGILTSAEAELPATQFEDHLLPQTTLRTTDAWQGVHLEWVISAGVDWRISQRFYIQTTARFDTGLTQMQKGLFSQRTVRYLDDGARVELIQGFTSSRSLSIGLQVGLLYRVSR